MLIHVIPTELKAVLTHAWSWAAWLKREQGDALRHGDFLAAERLETLCDNAYLDIVQFAAGAGIDVPPLPEMDDEGNLIVTGNPFGV